jgi:membrane protease YdiL (CAAX protease family)
MPCLRNSYEGEYKTNLDKFGIKIVFHVIVGVGILLIGILLSSLPFDMFYIITKTELSFQPLIIVVKSVLCIAIVFLLLYLYAVKLLKMPWNDFRVCKPKSIMLWILCATALPLAVSAFFIFLIPGTLADSNLDSRQIMLRILNTVFGSCFVAGITEEVIFRGFIMRLLEARWNKYAAIIAPSVLFGLLHIFNMENPDIVDILMLLIAGTSVGIMFSMIAYQSGSIWPGTAVHGIWNLIIIGGILEISVEPGNSICTYTLESQSTLLTGGAFGIESSVPAIIGYGLIILICAMLISRRSAKSA